MENGSESSSPSPAAVALIVGVTGMVGLSLAESLNDPSKTPPGRGGPWKVYGVARRPLPTWFPASLLHRFISIDAMDRRDTFEKLSPVAGEVTHVFWVALQMRQSEETNISMNSAMLSNVIDALKSSGGSSCSLRHLALQTGSKHYYMVPSSNLNHDGSRIMMHEPPFQEDMSRLPIPNFYYAQEDILASALPPRVTYSVHRSSVITGATPRSLFNMLLCLAIYATICKHQRLPFRYPGSKYTWEHFSDMSDSRLLAEQQIWASTTEKAKNQAFNCTNGDFFTWKALWKVFCQVFDVELDENDEGGFDVVGMMSRMGGVWDEIVEKHGLVRTKLGDIACFDALTIITNFKFQHVCSMNKSRKFGFMGYCDTLESIPYWVGRMRKMNIIP